jgi:hypothetical protein
MGYSPHAKCWKCGTAQACEKEHRQCEWIGKRPCKEVGGSGLF